MQKNSNKYQIIQVMLYNKIKLYSYILYFQCNMITSMKLKRLKKITTKKIQNLITSIQSRVPNNTKIHQPIVEMQEKKKIQKKEEEKI